MEYDVKIKKTARKDLPKLKAIHLHEKLDELLRIIKQDPYQTPPPYEKLVGLPYYSRRLNIKHRLVYGVDDVSRTITILSIWSHYERGI